MVLLSGPPLATTCHRQNHSPQKVMTENQLLEADLSSLSPEQLAELQKRVAAEKSARKKAFTPTRVAHVIQKDATLALKVPVAGGEVASVPVSVSQTSFVEVGANPKKTPIQLVIEMTPENAAFLLNASKDAAKRLADRQEVEAEPASSQEEPEA